MTLSSPSLSFNALTDIQLDTLRGNVTDNRRIRRARVLKDGKITFNEGGSLINCGIRDLTVSGAKVRLSVSTVLPEYFKLLCVADDILYPAKMVWRRGEYVGLSFVGPPTSKPRRKKACIQPSLD